MKLLFLYFSTIVIFLSIDFLWVGYLARDFYRTKLAHLMSDTMDWNAIIAFYLIFIAGLLFFTVIPALKDGSVKYAAFYGAFFGFVTFATYDLVNQALLKDWPWTVTITDIIWGTLLCAGVASISFWFAGYLKMNS